ncbi:MAG: RNA polymerase sigma factor [Ignavibacteria bacterium]|nr:RNA polymerase sigma factor [Ignavibacteria bacterium]MBT8393139.1 RNA polymerase sigma factor [Ignavibacteria bacterium]NNJ52633.1 RNA polymerase sigma factor [Ignavibacteriaceae bacterium]NNL21141.1 RNA polymerase sigma factor [Ignavibacteriaceae bacterium]
MEEKELIEKAKKGDKKALSEIVKRYEQTIYNFSFKICRDKNKAEQIMQETFYSMVKSLHQFDHNSKLSTWLYRIVSNHCLMMARKLKSRTFVSFDDDDNLFEEKFTADWSSLPYSNTENEELKSILDDAIQKLAPEYRMVFLLRDVEGLSTEEAAQVTNLSVPALKSRLHRARAFLRKELNEALSK